MNSKLIAAFVILTSASVGFPAYANHDDMGEHCTRHKAHKTFEEADADKDGTLDKEEAKAVCKMDFDKMDTDHDGTISQDELNACGRHKHKKSAKKTAQPEQ